MSIDSGEILVTMEDAVRCMSKCRRYCWTYKNTHFRLDDPGYVSYFRDSCMWAHLINHMNENDKMEVVLQDTQDVLGNRLIGQVLQADEGPK